MTLNRVASADKKTKEKSDEDVNEEEILQK